MPQSSDKSTPETAPVKRKISAKALLSDLDSGLSHQQIRAKYSLTEGTLQEVLDQLSEAGLLREIPKPSQLSSRVIPSFKCPHCGIPQPEGTRVCRDCQRPIKETDQQRTQAKPPGPTGKDSMRRRFMPRLSVTVWLVCGSIVVSAAIAASLHYGAKQFKGDIRKDQEPSNQWLLSQAYKGGYEPGQKVGDVRPGKVALKTSAEARRMSDKPIITGGTLEAYCAPIRAEFLKIENRLRIGINHEEYRQVVASFADRLSELRAKEGAVPQALELELDQSLETLSLAQQAWNEEIHLRTQFYRLTGMDSKKANAEYYEEVLSGKRLDHIEEARLWKAWKDKGEEREALWQDFREHSAKALALIAPGRNP